MQHDRCDQCLGKVVYKTRRHAAWDAKELSRKKQSGKLEPYRGPCGNWHVGRATPPEIRHKRKPQPKRRKWNWRKALDS